MKPAARATPRSRKQKQLKKLGKFTPALGQEVVNHLAIGNYLETAAHACGVDAQTVRNWIRIGRDEERRRALNYEPDPDLDHILAFSIQVREAMAQAEGRQVGNLIRAGKDDWRASAHFLERRYPKRWGSRAVLTIENEMERLLDKLERHLPAKLYERVLEVIAIPDELDSDDDYDDPST